MNPESARVARALYHIQIAAALISRFTDGMTLGEYNLNVMARSAVERQLIAIGEAVSVFYRLEPESARRITDYRRIISLRNRLAHGFFNVNSETIWRIIHDDIPILLREVMELLTEYEDR